MGKQTFCALRCHACSKFCVQLQKKSGKWACPVCGAAQSALRCYAVSDRAKDVRLAVQQLNAAFVEAIRLPDVKARFAEQGAEPVGNTSEQMGRFVRDEAVRWARIIKDANVTVD